MNKHIEQLIKHIRTTCLILRQGGPFGAFIFKGDINHPNIVSVGFNRVIVDHDPSAHAEIVAIREACRHVGSHDLTGYSIYASGYPCPMCMSAIMWANIKDVYYTGTYEDAANIGFRDEFIYNFIKNNYTGDKVKLTKIKSDSLTDLYKSFSTLDITY